MRRPALSLILALAATPVFACGDDAPGDAADAGRGADAGPGPTDMGAGADAGDGGTTADTGPADAGGPLCSVGPGVDTSRDPSCPSAASWFRFVEGTVRADGMAVADVLPQICVQAFGGNFACLSPEPSCDDGRWVRELPPMFRCIDTLVMRMQKLSGGTFATTYCDIEPTGEGVLSIAEPYELYPVPSATNLPPAGDGDTALTVDLQDGVRLEVVPNNLEFPSDYERLGVRRLTASDPRPCFLGPNDSFDAVYAFSVDLDVFRPNFELGGEFPVRLDNVANLAPSTTVDLWVQAPLGCSLPSGPVLEEGEWHQYGTATVSADGQYIEGGRLPCLNWFAYKAR